MRRGRKEGGEKGVGVRGGDQSWKNDVIVKLKLNSPICCSL